MKILQQDLAEEARLLRKVKEKLFSLLPLEGEEGRFLIQALRGLDQALAALEALQGSKEEEKVHVPTTGTWVLGPGGVLEYIRDPAGMKKLAEAWRDWCHDLR